MYCKIYTEMIKNDIYIQMEKEMATHSSVLDWRITWREEPGELQSMGSQKRGTRLKQLQIHTHIHPNAKSSNSVKNGTFPAASKLLVVFSLIAFTHSPACLTLQETINLNFVLIISFFFVALALCIYS